MTRKNRRAYGPKIDPRPVDPSVSVVDLIDQTFLSYNAGRLREAAQLFARKMLEPEVTIGLSLSGALTPAGLGISCLIPLIEHGFVDWIVSTGANLYHDTHFGIGLNLHQGSPHVSDVTLREEGVVRIYDIFFDYEVLLETDTFFRQTMTAPEFQRPMSTAEFHFLMGKYIRERERVLGQKRRSLLSVAAEYGVPIYTSSPGDSSIGMNVAEKAMVGNKLAFDVSRDVNETAALVYAAKKNKGKSGVIMLGGGSPKNFILQTEPQIQEVLGLAENGHDFYIQITDARPDTGGLSGATPSEGVTWGKVDPEALPDTIVCYTDSTIALPLITAYAVATRKTRTHKRLYDHREKMLAALVEDYRKKVSQG